MLGCIILWMSGICLWYDEVWSAITALLLGGQHLAPSWSDSAGEKKRIWLARVMYECTTQYVWLVQAMYDSFYLRTILYWGFCNFFYRPNHGYLLLLLSIWHTMLLCFRLSVTLAVGLRSTTSANNWTLVTLMWFSWWVSCASIHFHTASKSYSTLL